MQRKKLLIFIFFVGIFHLLVSFTYLPFKNIVNGNKDSSVYFPPKFMDQQVLLFMKALISETILSNDTFKQYRHESIRYFGQQFRMQRLIRKIFQGNEEEEPTLNILITGGSISTHKVTIIRINFIHNAIT